MFRTRYHSNSYSSIGLLFLSIVMTMAGACTTGTTDPELVGCEAQEEVVITGELVSSNVSEVLDLTTERDADPECHCYVTFTAKYKNHFDALPPDTPKVDFL